MKLERAALVAGITLADLFFRAGVTNSKSAARRLAEQGGAYVNEKRIASGDAVINETYVQNGCILLRQGKKNYRRIVFS